MIQAENVDVVRDGRGWHVVCNSEAHAPRDSYIEALAAFLTLVDEDSRYLVIARMSYYFELKDLAALAEDKATEAAQRFKDFTG